MKQTNKINSPTYKFDLKTKKESTWLNMDVFVVHTLLLRSCGGGCVHTGGAEKQNSLI